jgi:NAD-dependent deacetylase
VAHLLRPLGVDGYERIVVLTGAGVSASAGLPTFRGVGAGRFTDLDELLDCSSLPGSLERLWSFTELLRARVSTAVPTAAHRVLAGLAARRGGGPPVVVTQNIDGLHQQAGSQVVHELHGSVWSARCLAGCGAAPTPLQGRATRTCTGCGAPLRPGIVLYGEPLERDAHEQTMRSLVQADLFIAVGTSGVTLPASKLGRVAREAGAHCVLVNLEPHEDPAPWFHETHLGPADELLPRLLGPPAPPPSPPAVRRSRGLRRIGRAREGPDDPSRATGQRRGRRQA